jgi:hypothetical protein
MTSPIRSLRTRARPPSRRRDTTGGVDGNERLTAAAGAVLLVLFAAEGMTILAVRQLLTLHFFLGMLLIGPVGFQNSATGLDLRFYAARWYSLRRPPRTGRRLIRCRERSAIGWSGRGGRSPRLRGGRRPL